MTLVFNSTVQNLMVKRETLEIGSLLANVLVVMKETPMMTMRQCSEALGKETVF